jgi:hypothetical protein
LAVDLPPAPHFVNELIAVSNRRPA